MYYIPIIGAVALATSTLMEKLILRKKETNIKLFQTTVFFVSVVVMLPFLYFFWRVDAPAIEVKNLLIFAGIIISSLMANLFIFFSLKWEKVTNIEPARLLEPLLVILLAILFSHFIPDLYDRNLKVIVPGIIAALALVFSHLEKHHLKFNKYFLAAIAGSFFFALELVMSRLILDFYSVLSFYFLRCTAVFLISFAMFHPHFKQLNNKTRWQIVLTGSIWVIYRIIVYYGYLTLGVIFTTLMIMLGPIFIYFFAHAFLKEKMNWKNTLASIIIVASVLYATLG